MTQSPTPSPTSKPIAEQITEIVINLLFVSSCGYTLFNVVQSDLPKALISLAISAITGLASSFGEGLMDTLKERWKKRGQKLGEVLDKPVTLALGTIFPKPQYLEALKTYCYDLEVEGLKGDFPSLGLEEVFVPLSLDSDPAGFSSSTSIKQVWALLPKDNETATENRYRRIAIVANPGYGKTTLTRYLTLKYANSSYQEFGAAPLLPILLILRNIHREIEAEQTPKLPHLIEQQVKKLPRCQDLEMSAAWFENHLKGGRCLVMLDGLDEVPESHRAIVSRWANWQMQTYPSQFILTSRLHGYDESLFFRGVERIGIIDFTLDQKEDFIYKWYKAVLWNKKWESHWQKSQMKSEYERLSKEQARFQSDAEAEVAAKDLIRQIIETPNLNELAKNPLLITIIAATHRAFAALPKRRVEIYKKMFNLLLADRPNFRDTPLTISAVEDNQEILQQLAFFLTNQNQLQFTVEQISDFLQPLLTKYDAEQKLTPKKFLGEIQQIAGLLTGGESNLYQFSHKTFQEYLTAAELKHRRDSNFLIRKINDGVWKEWEEVIRFYAAMIDSSPFIQALLETTDKDALLLAYRIGIEDAPNMPSALRLRLYRELQQVDLGSHLNAKVKLGEQFQTPICLNETTAISSHYITWKEYQFFLEAQRNNQFHSKASIIELKDCPLDSSILPITWTDARWFCAWLSTQTDLQPDDGIYVYRLPFPTELAQFRSPTTGGSEIAPWTIVSSTSGNALRVVRVKIDPQYRALVNFLASGRWKDADQETERLVLKLADCQEEGHLTLTQIQEFPCTDLCLIDQLWTSFSGNKFGFSVQRQIWLEAGGKLDFGEDKDAAIKTFKQLSERNGWRTKRETVKYSALNFSIDAPLAQFPTLYGASRVLPGTNLGQAWIGWCALLSQLEVCTTGSQPPSS